MLCCRSGFKIVVPSGESEQKHPSSMSVCPSPNVANIAVPAHSSPMIALRPMPHRIGSMGGNFRMAPAVAPIRTNDGTYQPCLPQPGRALQHPFLRLNGQIMMQGITCCMFSTS